MFKIALDAFCGVAGLLLALYLAKLFADPETRPRVHKVLIVFLLIVLYEGLKFSIGPPLLAWKARQEIAKLFVTDKLLSVVTTDFPNLRPPIQANYVKAYQVASADQALGIARATAGSVLPKYLSKAPDASVLRFSKAMVHSLEAMQKNDPVRCYRYLYPSAAGPMVPNKDEGLDEINTALQEAVLSAHEHPVPPDMQSAPRLMGVVGSRLFQKYGPELAMLQRPLDPKADRAKICAMTISLYSNALALEPPDSAKVFRLIYSQ
jgi:DNA-binding transcriptional regulator YdaS (Cro superfamily)